MASEDWKEPECPYCGSPYCDEECEEWAEAETWGEVRADDAREHAYWSRVECDASDKECA